MMKPSLAFVGALLVVFATGALLDKAIDTNVGTSLSHPTLSLFGLAADGESADNGGLIPGLAPDWESITSETGVFVPNLGQVTHDVYFQFIGTNHIAHFRAASIGIEERSATEIGNGRVLPINVRFVGANRRPGVHATGGATPRLSYGGVNASQEFTATVPLFSELSYSGLYDGIDLRVLATEPGIRRVFTVQPGADPERPLFHYDGADNPVISQSATLHISTPGGALTYPSPVAFQMRDGQRQTVAVSYRMGRFGAFGFSVGSYDTSLPLVIEAEGI